MAKVHIGKKIKEVWKHSRMKGTEFAALINRDRQVIYDIFKRESIDTDLLKKISKVLQHDFFKYYSNDFAQLTEPGAAYGYVTKAEFEEMKEMVADMSLKLNVLIGDKTKKSLKKNTKQKLKTKK